jgi:diguanylate cyclase (GGDEF)-like protein
MGSATPSRATMARVAAYLWAAGALTVLVILALPHGDDVDVPVAWAILAVCTACGLAMWGYGERFPTWVFHAGLVLATVAITGAVQSHDDPGADIEMLYLWIALYGFYFFGWRAALAHLALVGVGYAAVLAGQQGGDARVMDWLFTASGLLGAGWIVGLLRDRVVGLVDTLETAAVTDALTGLLNRDGFEAVISTELERARRHERQLALVVGDVDHFKQVNDRFGHQAGDTALELLGTILAEAIRRLDTIARIGGEEFAIVMPDADEQAAFLLAERLRRDVRESFNGTVAELTMSFGVAAFPKDAESSSRLLQAADRALYLAKALGRDRSVVYNDETSALLAELIAERDPASS